MIDLPTKVSLKCLFCGLKIQMDEKKSKHLKSGDQVKCSHCKEKNDFDSMFKVIEEEATKLAEQAI